MTPFPQSVFECLKQSPTARGELLEWLQTLRLEYESTALTRLTERKFDEASVSSAKSQAVADILAQLTAYEREEVAQHEYRRQNRTR